MLRANPTFQRKLICVKIKGDRTSVNKAVHLVVIGFPLLDFVENPSSPYRCHTIALLNTNEDYDNL